MARDGLKVSFFSRKFWTSVPCISDLIIYTYCLQIHIPNLDLENETFSELNGMKEPNCQKRKYNPEPTIFSGPGSPECKKRKYNPEPADELTSSLDDIDFSEFDLAVEEFTSSLNDINFSEFDLDMYPMWDCCKKFVIFSTIFKIFKLIIVPDG